jgi:hypothetical protein
MSLPAGPFPLGDIQQLLLASFDFVAQAFGLGFRFILARLFLRNRCFEARALVIWR